MAMSDTLANKFLDKLLGTDFTAGPLYLALMTDPTTEVTAGEYSRVSLDSLLDLTGDTLTLNTSISFPEATSSWGLITHTCVYNADVAGEVYFTGASSSVKSVSTGEVYTILVNNFTIQLD